jgi:hypothetical protein
MNEREGMTHVREGQERARAKGGGGKGKKTVDKRSKETPAQEAQAEGGRLASEQQPSSEGSGGKEAQDPHMMARIQQRAYLLFEAAGFQHGHDLEHWLEAERQIAGTSNHPER